MSDDADFARDKRLGEALRRLPAPSLPAGFAERLVREVTSLPQHDQVQLDRTGVVAQETIFDAAPVQAEADRSLLRRRLAWAAGAAIAASLVAALLLRQQDTDAPAQAGPIVQVAQDAPAAAVPTPGFASSHTLAKAPSLLPSPAAEMASETYPAQVPPAPQSSSAAPAQRAPNPKMTPATPTPEIAAQEVPPLAPQPLPSRAPEQALMGPPAPDDLGTPLEESGRAPGFGISGAGSMPPVVTSPAPQQRGGHPGGMPRF